MYRWKPNEELGVFWKHSRSVWRRLRDDNDKAFELENGVLLIRKTVDSDARKLWDWMHFVTNRQVNQPVDSNIDPRQKATMGDYLQRWESALTKKITKEYTVNG
jgi:hypothetical protein